MVQADEWDRLVATHGPALWRTIRRLLGPGDENTAAADCFQETFLEFFDLARRTRVTYPGGLIVRIGTRRAIDLIRRRAVQRRRYQRVEALESERVTANAAPDDVAWAEELEHLLREALAALAQEEAEQAAVFCLTQFEGMCNADVAQLLGLRVNHIAVLLHRARQRLAERLKQLPRPSRR
jgi:RNA polymerase sigma factor (sigma-70 family)